MRPSIKRLASSKGVIGVDQLTPPLSTAHSGRSSNITVSTATFCYSSIIVPNNVLEKLFIKGKVIREGFFLRLVILLMHAKTLLYEVPCYCNNKATKHVENYVHMSGIYGTCLTSSTPKTNYNFVRLYFYRRTLLTKMNIAVRAFQVWSDDFSLKIKQEIKIKIKQYPFFCPTLTRTMGQVYTLVP